MKKLLLILMLGCCGQTFAQQDALYSQYMFNPFAVNPAYAGSRNSYSSVLLYRYQWVGIPGSPKTASFALHAPTTKLNLVWGFGTVVETLGPTNSVSFGGTIGYQLKLRKSKLTFALRGGGYYVKLNHKELQFKDLGDQFNIGNDPTATIIPSVDFGAYYFKKKFYIGLSINHLTGGKIAFDTTLFLPPLDENSGLYLTQHLFLSSGYVIRINENIALKPSIMFKYVVGAPANIDLNFSALFYKKIWFGISTRISPANISSIVFMTDVNITDFMRIGYAFDVSLGKLAAYAQGSHELFIGFDFNLKNNKKDVSPRYL